MPEGFDVVAGVERGLRGRAEDCRTWVWVRARDEEALEAVRRALPVDWVM